MTDDQEFGKIRSFDCNVGQHLANFEFNFNEALLLILLDAQQCYIALQTPSGCGPTFLWFMDVEY